MTRLAVEFLERVEAGDPMALTTGIRLAERVLVEAQMIEAKTKKVG